MLDTAGAGEGTTPQAEWDGKPLGPPGDHFLNQLDQWGFLGASKGASVCSPAPTIRSSGEDGAMSSHLLDD